MDKDFNEIPLSESNVSLKLAAIQKRCSKFLRDSEDSLELRLEELELQPEDSNPYNHG
ncbi:MAG: hypothetical protein OEQ90_11430 [Gammaproteobacteria bacterium]|nr:hypothetical protein [Gammaproteobacteria bacterium]